ncbi:hypothetical protein KIPE111705_33440 [Kibdelosporangium persicum]|uniref:Anti-anti-sigma factor n=1 Tax=Kibdelosporangium persicum TaxID=2698649 RepID=A0ABX2EYR2_9PSEU|nr:hypothetical protein [Kibdelosporangium persicum]NRN64132.1 Anti-anti-sigma factor [Kibdelosporangium persicum]
MRISELRVPVRYIGGIAIAHPVGTLDVTTYPVLRDTLLKHAAEQPDGLVVELDELTMPIAPTLSVFSLVSMRVADWPGLPFMLVATGQEKRCMLAASTISRFVTVHDSVDTAVSAMAKPPIRQRAIMELPPSPMSTRRARYFVRMNCTRWRVDELITDAMTVATAFVENTLSHTSSAAFLRLEMRQGMLTIAVTDDDPRPAVLHERAEGGVSPSGLLLVSGITKVWGCTPAMTGGKTVWAVLKVPHGV